MVIPVLLFNDTYTLSDEYGNKKYFYSDGRLTKIVNANGNTENLTLFSKIFKLFKNVILMGQILAF